MVINTEEELKVGSTTIGTILNIQKIEHPVHLKILREIDLDEYIRLLKETEFAWTLETLNPYDGLRYYEVESLPD